MDPDHQEIEEEPDTEDESSVADNGKSEKLRRSTRNHRCPARYEASI